MNDAIRLRGDVDNNNLLLNFDGTTRCTRCYHVSRLAGYTAIVLLPMAVPSWTIRGVPVPNVLGNLRSNVIQQFMHTHTDTHLHSTIGTPPSTSTV